MSSDIQALNSSMLDAIRELDQALAELKSQAAAFAMAEREYRRSWSIAIVGATGKNAEERAAKAEQHRFATGDLSDIRYQRDLADGLKSSASQTVKAKTQVVSALQSMASGIRQELRFAQTGPEYS